MKVNKLLERLSKCSGDEEVLIGVTNGHKGVREAQMAMYGSTEKLGRIRIKDDKVVLNYRDFNK